MKASLLAVSILCIAVAPAQAQRACKGPSALVHSDTVSFLLDAPKGWILDCEAGRSDGPLTVLYRVGESWRDGHAVMYASMLHLAPGGDPDMSKRIEAEMRQWKSRVTDAVVARGQSIRTRSGLVVPVRRFTSKANGLHEAVAYVPRGPDMPVLAMTARSAVAFENALPAFEALVRSYAVGPTVRHP
jgi:hypothetical protein